MSLLTVGTVAFDSIKTPFDAVEKILGGAGTYACLSASYFGVKSRIVSVVGGDFPQKYFDVLKSKNIDIEGIKIVPNEKTFFWAGEYHSDMNSRSTLATELNVFEKFDAQIPDFYKETDFLLLANLHPSIQNSVLNQMAKRPKLVVMDTMDFWMDNAWDELINTIKKVDILTINDEEARQLSNEYSLVKASKKILSMGPKFLIIKKGEHGAFLFSENDTFFAPAVPLENVVDPTGAGDTFAGGFIGFLSQNNDLSFDNMKRAIIYGSVMASFAVENFGTDKLMNITDEEIKKRLHKISSLTRFSL